jgi:redox-sensitive bicupin YhaK (pirin superfamily)
MSLRAVKEIIQTKPTLEGAGVKLERAFGFGKTAEFDPFLLLDDFRNNAAPLYDASNHSLVLFDRGDEITVQAGPEGIRFLLVSGKPIEEPVAWYGPIVMNTQAEIRQAVAELNNGGFIRHR